MTVKRADVCIVGGGLMGAWSALFLRQRGQSVILVESGMAAPEGSDPVGAQPDLRRVLRTWLVP